MKKLTRRDSLALLVFSPLAAWGSGNQPAPAPPAQRRWAEIAPREMIRQRYFPDVVLQTQENKQVQLYRDLIKDKVMLINFMYASCNGICPRVTQNLVKLAQTLSHGQSFTRCQILARYLLSGGKLGIVSKNARPVQGYVHHWLKAGEQEPEGHWLPHKKVKRAP